MTTFILGILATLLFLFIFVASPSTGNRSAPNQNAADALRALESAQPSALQPHGELAEIFSYGSDFTDLQRQLKIKEITGNVVAWKLPVYEVKQSGNTYIIQTSHTIKNEPFGKKVVGTFLRVAPRNAEDTRVIERMKTGDIVSFKGIIEDVTMRSLNISPTILLYASESNVRQNSPGKAADASNFGKCTVHDKDIGDSYTGGCENGLAQGEGIAKGRDEYRGAFSKGYADGYGVYVWGSTSAWAGQQYAGELKQDYRNGFGESSVNKDATNSAEFQIHKSAGQLEGNRYVLRGYFEHNDFMFRCNSKKDCDDQLAKARNFQSEHAK